MDATTENRRLTQKEYWDAGYVERSVRRSWLQWLGEKVLSRAAVEFFIRGGLGEHLLVNAMLACGVPKRSGKKLLELGSAPGKRLVFWHQRFEYEPYGAEYAEHGVSLNRQTFHNAGLNPDNVLHADIFDPGFQDANAGRFDVVSSIGLIEHFADPADAVAKHHHLLARGGYLVVVIPNLRGIHYWLTRFFNPEAIAVHNLEIMTRPAFRELFAGLDVEELYCDYLGSLSLSLQNTKPGSWKKPFLTLGRIMEAPVELLRWKTLGARLPASRRSSPYLVFIGRKK